MADPTTKPKPKRKSRAKKKAAPLVDTLGRSFPPEAADIKAIGGKAVDRKHGRPYAIRSVEHAIETLEGLGMIMATSKECAAVMRISEVTLFEFFKRVPEAHDAWKRGKEGGKVSLRRSQMKLAEKNATMGIFLGMNYLEQKDRRAVSGDPNNPLKHEHGGSVAVTGKLKVENDYSNLSLDDLVRLHAAGVGTKKD